MAPDGKAHSSDKCFTVKAGKQVSVDLWSVNLAERASLRVNGYFWED